MGMTYDITTEDRTVQVEIEAMDGGWKVRLDGGDWRDVPGRWLRDGELLLTGVTGNRTIGTHVEGERFDVQVAGHAIRGTVVDPRKVRADLAGGAGEGTVVTPMPGVVVRIPVEVGQAVEAGQVLVVVEAMKMENEFKAPVSGVVESIDVAVGQALEANAVLVHLGEGD